MAYLCAGYYVTRRSDRGAYISPELMPERVLSASGCICDFFPDTWAIAWTSVPDEERTRKAAGFGISPADLNAVTKWATDSFSKEFGWPDAFYTLEAAQAARARFLPGKPDILIFGLGLHESDAEEFLKAAEPPAQQPGFAPMGRSGILECVSGGANIREGGEFLGFELLAADHGMLSCSWLCNGLEKECAAQLGIRPNRSGLVESYADARRCAELIARPETGAEPGLWLPWRVTMYSDAPTTRSSPSLPAGSGM